MDAPTVLEPSELGRVLRERRESLHMARSDLARLTGIRELTIANIEKGESDPRYSTLMNIAGGLGIRDLNELKPATYDADIEAVGRLASAMAEIGERTFRRSGSKLKTPSGVAQLAARLTVNQ